MYFLIDAISFWMGREGNERFAGDEVLDPFLQMGAFNPYVRINVDAYVIVRKEFVGVHFVPSICASRVGIDLSVQRVHCPDSLTV